MRALHLLALMLPLAACAAPPAGDVTVKPTPYGTPCTRPCKVRLVNNTTQALALHAATADGTRVLGTVPAGKEMAFGETVISPQYSALPVGVTAEAHGNAAASGAAPVKCEQLNPRPDEDVLLVCK